MLFDKLSQYNKKDIAPFHMPGHKRNTRMLGDDLPYGIDITEIDGFDNLHDPQGVLKETAQAAADLYGCRKVFLLVSGGTGGILAGIHSAVQYGDTIIMARNCHKAVYNAVELCGLKPVYLSADIDAQTGLAGSIRPEQVKKAANDHPDARLVVITSPTYEGIVSDIPTICAVAHAKDIPVLVDSAHGAHLGFSVEFPPSAVSGGADIVITSLHKTLPALTQSGLVLLNGSRIDENRLSAALSIFQTSSPSYVLLSSIDRCVRLLSEQGQHLFENYIQNLKAFDARVQTLKNLTIVCHGAHVLSNHAAFFAVDPGKIVIDTGATRWSGPDLMKQLRAQYDIELEMATARTAVAMTSICDEADDFTRLAEALNAIDTSAQMHDDAYQSVQYPALPQRRFTAAQAAGMDGALTPLDEAVGRVSLEYVWAYPPGIPFLVPGEVIDRDMLRIIGILTAKGIDIKSTIGALPRLNCAASGRSTH